LKWPCIEGELRALISPSRKTRKIIQETAPRALKAIRLLESIRQSLDSGTERFSFYRQRRDLYLLALSLAAATDNGDMALEVMDVARSDGLASLLHYKRADVPGRFGELLQRIAELEANHPAASALLPNQHQLSSSEDVTSNITAELKALYQEVAEYSPILRAAIDPIPRDMQDPHTASPNQYIVLYDFDFRNRSCFTVWEEPTGKSHIQATQLSPGVVDILDAWTRRETGTYDGPFDKFEELSSILLPEKLRKSLGGDTGEIPRLVVIPSGALWALPIAALPIDGRLLIECAEISYAPSLSVYDSLKGGHAGSGASAYFAEHLRGTELEREALNTIFGTSFRELNQADLRNSLRSGNAASLRMLVLSAHGDDRPGLAHGLQLKDGKLTAAELLSYRLPDLVVLGACSSAKLELSRDQSRSGYRPHAWQLVRGR
jgi:hypothetical protein